VHDHVKWVSARLARTPNRVLYSADVAFFEVAISVNNGMNVRNRFNLGSIDVLKR
jgi:hypothetical protein